MAEETITVRRASRDDVEALWPLVKDFATSYVPERNVFEDSFIELVVAPDTVILVAERGSGDLVGYTLANYHGTLFANGNVAWIEELMVIQSARLSGVGRALVRGVEEWACEVPASYISLATRRADAFYHRLGYQLSANFYKKELVG